MRLLELDPQFYRAEEDGRILAKVDTAAEAQGVMFDCPACTVSRADARARGEDIGVHKILVWFDGRGTPAGATPTPRWGVNGSGYGDLTTSPSIQIRGPCNWHGFITNGEIRTC